jgi:hypothetical protein
VNQFVRVWSQEVCGLDFPIREIVRPEKMSEDERSPWFESDFGSAGVDLILR